MTQHIDSIQKTDAVPIAIAVNKVIYIQQLNISQQLTMACPQQVYNGILSLRRLSSFAECMVRSSICSTKFLEYLEKESDFENSEKNLLDKFTVSSVDWPSVEIPISTRPKRKRLRQCKLLTLYYFNENGEIAFFTAQTNCVIPSLYWQPLNY